MVLITLQYVPARQEAAFLIVKEEVSHLLYYQIAFFSHVYTSIFVLIIGLFQFSNRLRNRIPKLHRWLGMFYTGMVLFVSSPSGFVMGLHANGGFYSQISFCLQAVLWFIFTYLAFNYAPRKKTKKIEKSIVLHQSFVLRSYALTCSAITLRLIKWVTVSFYEFPPMDLYRFTSWAGWILNLILVEIYIFYSYKYQK